MNARWLSLAFLLSLMTATAAVADLPLYERPNPPPRRVNPPSPVVEEVPLKIKHGTLPDKYEGAEARIIIPKHILLKIAQKQSASTGDAWDAPRTQPWSTVLAGIALAVAAASGIWVLRRREARVVATGALLVVVSCAAWNLVHGDLIIPGGKDSRRPPAKPDLPPRPTPTIIIETSDGGDAVTLILKPKA